MFRVFSVAVYDFVQKRTKNPKLRTLYYFLVMGLIWGLFTFAIGALGQLRDFLAGEIEQELYFKVIIFLPLAASSWATSSASSPGCSGSAMTLTSNDPAPPRKASVFRVLCF